MKRLAFIRYPQQHGCVLLREGGKHSVFVNRGTQKSSTVPRHREIDENLVRKVCKGSGSSRAVVVNQSLSIDVNGLLSAATFVASPNFDDRPPHSTIRLLVIHNISLPPGEFSGVGIIELFTNRLDPEAHPYYQAIAHQRVSAHFLIRRDGEIIQFVPCAKRAWHAGVSSWCGQERCNDFSIGVELEGCDSIPFTDCQYESLTTLTKTLRATYPISDIKGHSDIAPDRKTDPGPCFDWQRYRAALAAP